jgi:predicted unusual protein kinase regulating ubiquinone biosynthesis (AarF/ABC1/UbiB family)
LLHSSKNFHTNVRYSLSASPFLPSLTSGLAREMNTNLPLELDFTKEAQNIEKCRQLMRPMIQSGELALPEVYGSTPRVLVMSFEEGCYLTNADKINEMGVNKGEVARLISKTFCEQM